jgi:hypothetical protein
MPPKPAKSTMRLGRDLESFESLPAQTQDLATLQDLASKTTGTENAAVHEEIQEMAIVGTPRKRAKPARP